MPLERKCEGEREVVYFLTCLRGTPPLNWGHLKTPSFLSLSLSLLLISFFCYVVIVVLIESMKCCILMATHVAQEQDRLILLVAAKEVGPASTPPLQQHYNHSPHYLVSKR